MKKSRSILIALGCFLGFAGAAKPLPGHPLSGKPLPGRSIYPLRPDDTAAIYFTSGRFNIRADGSMDISDALQQAIREVTGRFNVGILFIPEG